MNENVVSIIVVVLAYVAVIALPCLIQAGLSSIRISKIPGLILPILTGAFSIMLAVNTGISYINNMESYTDIQDTTLLLGVSTLIGFTVMSMFITIYKEYRFRAENLSDIEELLLRDMKKSLNKDLTSNDYDEDVLY